MPLLAMIQIMLFMQFVAWAVSALTWTYRRMQLAMCLCPFSATAASALAPAGTGCDGPPGPSLTCWRVERRRQRSRRGAPGVLWASPDNTVLPGGEDAQTREERTVAAQSVLALLRCPCSCIVHKRRCGRDHRLGMGVTQTEPLRKIY